MTTQTENNPTPAKRLAAVRAAQWIRNGMKLGLGTGSTIHHLLDHIAERRADGEWLDVVGVPTSEDTARRAERLCIPLSTLDEHSRLDLAIDGADEVDPQLRLIKGLGGALLREKIVANAAERVVIAVDDSKLVPRLGSRAPLPVEVDPFGAEVHLPFLRCLGAEPAFRLSIGGERMRSDGGNYLIDCRFPEGLSEPVALERQLNDRPGILENGMFLDFASHVVVGSTEGVWVLDRPDRSR